jgi:hypothetical protein
MRVDFADTLERIVQLEKELEREIKKKNREIVKNYHKQKIRFEESIRKQQEKYRVNLLRYVFNARLRSFVLAPIIYFMVIPISFFDVSIFIYQHITFRVLGIPIVERKDYFTIDRHHLGYLNLLEKFNCVYCGYGNGVTSYGKEILARTEQYWCPIKHSERIKDPHTRYYNFFEYGDAEGYRDKLDSVILNYGDGESIENGENS